MSCAETPPRSNNSSPVSRTSISRLPSTFSSISVFPSESASEPEPFHRESPSAKPSRSQRNARYYNEILTFKVEDQLFRESTRYFVANSDFFRKTLDADAETVNSAGQSDEHPLILKDVPADDFESLLSVIYPLNPLKQTELSYDGWKGVIKLATKWGMKSLRKHCIEKLSPLPESMSIIEKILYARECMVVNWLVNAYNQLAQRKETISDEVAMIIGMEAAFYILRLREEVLQKQYTTSETTLSTSLAWTSHDYRIAIQDVFDQEMTGWDKDEIWLDVVTAPGKKGKKKPKGGVAKMATKSDR